MKGDYLPTQQYPIDFFNLDPMLFYFALEIYHYFRL